MSTPVYFHTFYTSPRGNICFIIPEEQAEQFHEECTVKGLGYGHSDYGVDTIVFLATDADPTSVQQFNDLINELSNAYQ